MLSNKLHIASAILAAFSFAACSELGALRAGDPSDKNGVCYMNTNHPLTADVIGIGTKKESEDRLSPLYVSLGKPDLLSDGKTYIVEAKNLRTSEYTVMRINPEAKECSVSGVTYPLQFARN